MLSFRIRRVLVFAFLHYVDSQRRIKDGFEVKENKQYMAKLTTETLNDSVPKNKSNCDFKVYLVEVKTPLITYYSWICGGCIVSRWFILTSAACIEDVRTVFAISGTKKYIPNEKVYKDACTAKTKKKVVFTCVPKEYELDMKVEHWSYNDIALAKVEVAYDFDDNVYEMFCQYKPISIQMNFDVKNEQIGTEVIVLGYGHTQFWRQHNEYKDFNSHMQYSASKIYNVEECKHVYRSPDLLNNIEKYMICTNGLGNIDENGKPLNISRTRIRRTHQETDLKMQSTRKKYDLKFNLNTRRQGFCQNDHGGPLVAWIDGNETVIGVASVFQINQERECTGPYLYTSVARNELFIKCVIDDNRQFRRKECNQPASVMGFSILKRYILWNENDNNVVNDVEVRIRPQINMNFIREG